MTVWQEKWLSYRNTLLSNPQFQAWAGRFPLTRFVARQRARGLFDIVAGFVYSQVAFAIVDLEILPMVSQAPRSAHDVATAINMDVATVQRLLQAAESLDILQQLSDGRYVPGVHGAALLGNPGVVAMIRHHQTLYADLGDPLALLQRGGGGGKLAAFWPYAEGKEGSADQQAFDAYSKLMAASQPMVAQQVLGSYPLRKHRFLVDVGGGEGAFISHVARACPQLKLGLFDMPPVAERARVRLSEMGLSDRVAITGGSFHEDDLPRGADIMSLVRILHDHDDNAAQHLLAKIARALPRGGSLLIAEPMANVPGARPVGHAYFGMYLLAMGSGRPRSQEELGAMLLAAGFRTWRAIPTAIPLAASLIVAKT